MTFTVSVITVLAVLFGAVIGIIAVLVSGIRSDDRAKSITASPRTLAETTTRRVPGVGGRNGHAGRAQDEER